MATTVNVSQERGVRRRLTTVGALLVCAASLLAGAVAHAATAAPAATLRDPANDVRAGDIDLTSISVSKRNGALVVRFTVRRPITDNVSYTASVGAGTGSWALVARRSGGSRLLPALQPLDGADHEHRRADRRPQRDGHGSDRGAGRADECDAGPAQRVLPSRAGRRPERRRRPCRHDGADDLVLPHGSTPEAEVGPVHLARPGSLNSADLVDRSLASIHLTGGRGCCEPGELVCRVLVMDSAEGVGLALRPALR